MQITTTSEASTMLFARKLAKCCQANNQAIVIYLTGDLGSGKTTLARGFIQYFGFNRVKSPTYSLVESYECDNINIHHFDLYRLSSPQELDYIGIREYSSVNSMQLIEWAQLGKGFIAPPDITITLSGVDIDRNITIIAHNKTSIQILECLEY